MKVVLLALALLLVSAPADAGCFLFFCSHKHRAVDRVTRNCETITLAFTQKTMSRDDFVKSFPARKQRKVLLCLGDDK